MAKITKQEVLDYLEEYIANTNLTKKEKDIFSYILNAVEGAYIIRYVPIRRPDDTYLVTVLGYIDDRLVFSYDKHTLNKNRLEALMEVKASKIIYPI